ncbi:PREDICTED: cuticle protein 3-like [Nicrophorus vespilloides]|uniref:Cuticle protein 3-like n=1 Tax=Nicrophorus vespilloides TaxID=110193 RepID=A0ABM1NGQ9_NICVS|nr:PREDICTED: cuticle protein 3-like [Nicrophorus vespilloides]
MKQFIVFALVGLAFAEPPSSQYGPPGYNSNANNNNVNNNNQHGNNYNGIPNANNDVPILRLENSNDGEGGYKYAYETGDGTSAQEHGYLKDADSPTAQGGFAFTAPDGQQFSISYTADENGFVPVGNHLPTPPPIPEEILKALEQNRADEARGIVDDGQYHPEPAPHQQYNNAQQNAAGGTHPGY